MKVLIIGQGIAGTMLAFTLRNAGAQVTLVEGQLPGRSSEVAAGVINPVTGKRYVKSWRYEEFFRVARRCYKALESELGIAIWEERPILRLLGSPEETNDWSVRCAQADYSEFLGEISTAGDWAPLLKPGFHFGLIRQAARVNFPKLMTAYRERARQTGQLLEQTVGYQDIEPYLKKYDRIVFCDGYRALQNPFFPDLPWQLAKGEALFIRFRDPVADRIGDMLKKTSLIAPLGDGLFWAGGSYQWQYPDLEPSDSERDNIQQRIGEMLIAQYDIVGHTAGVRPTVKDRRPILGESKVLPNVFIFNGLGTKGALLAPFWAEHFAAYLLEGTALEATVSLRSIAQ